MAADRHFGHIPNVAVGATFANRDDAGTAGVHRPRQAGISGGAAEGADSIVVSGGYEDDEDYGDLIIYTGHGGRDPASGLQIADQTLTRQNLALARSSDERLPVRVVRGADGDPTYSPLSGYRYDGLYSVERYWSEIGKSGHRVWRFRLVQSTEPLPVASEQRPTADRPDRVETTVQRIARNVEVSQRVKHLHDYCCQICGQRLKTPSGPYAEAAHIRPLGRPHDGPDTIGNVLCLCPNHHILLDRGGIVIADDLEVIQTQTNSSLGTLRQVGSHRVNLEMVQYHRNLFIN